MTHQRKALRFLLIFLFCSSQVLYPADFAQGAESLAATEQAPPQDRPNGVFLSAGLPPFFVSPSLGYIRRIGQRFLVMSYLNYSIANSQDVLQSFKNAYQKNLDAEESGFVLAIAPQVVFHTFDWPDAKSQLYCGFIVGYYDFNLNLKPGTKSANNPEPPLSAAGSDRWRNFAAGMSIGLHVQKSDRIFLLLGFGLIFAQTRSIDFTVTNKDGSIESGIYRHYSSNYSFSPQVTIALGFSF